MKEKKTNCGIYQITNLVPNKETGICKVYIGSSINLKNRKYKHFWDLRNNEHLNKYLQKSFNKYGEGNFKWEVIRYIEKYEDKEKLKEELLKYEQYYIDEYIIDNEIDIIRCYNLCTKAGNSLGYKHSKESKQKISLNMLGKSYEEIYGKERSNLIKKNKSDKNKGKNNFFYGKNHTEEARNKMRENNTRKKKVINLTTNVVFNSLTEASNYYKVDIASISKVCKGIKKTAGKYVWRYYE